MEWRWCCGWWWWCLKQESQTHHSRSTQAASSVLQRHKIRRTSGCVFPKVMQLRGVLAPDYSFLILVFCSYHSAPCPPRAACFESSSSPSLAARFPAAAACPVFQAPQRSDIAAFLAQVDFGVGILPSLQAVPASRTASNRIISRTTRWTWMRWQIAKRTGCSFASFLIACFVRLYSIN